MTRGSHVRSSLPVSPFARTGLAARVFAGVLAFSVAACGGAAFQRAANAPKYGPLPVGTKVRIAANVADLPGESQVLGTLHTITRGDPANRVEAENAFRTAAARYGCDVAAGLESKRKEIRTTKKVRSIGANGATVWVDEQTITAEHDWTAQCMHTPDAPSQLLVAATVAKEEPEEVKPEPVRPKRRTPDPKPEVVAVQPKPRVEPKPEPKLEPKPEVVAVQPKPRVEPKPEPKLEPKPEVVAVQPKPRVETKPEVKPEPKPVVVEKPVEKPVRPAPERPLPEKPTVAERPTPPQPEKPAALPIVTTSPADAKIGSEIAKMFLQWSGAWARGDVDKLCGSFEESVVFNVSASQPKLKLKQEMTAADACASLKEGELSSYIRELGPAEVHAEVATLIPELFRIHGGAFLNLEPDVQKRYTEAVATSRVGKKPLACTMYTVTPKDEANYQISLSCQGVTSFKVFVAKGADGAWKVKAFSHVR